MPESSWLKVLMCSASHVSHPLHVSSVGPKLGMVFWISLWRSMICIAKPEDACHANERRENVNEVSELAGLFAG